MSRRLDNHPVLGYSIKAWGRCLRPQAGPTKHYALEDDGPHRMRPVGAVFLVIERRRLQETADYPMNQQTGYYAGGHVPEENIQWDLLNDRRGVTRP